MILNSGLDAACTAPSPTSQFITWAAYGTGSAAPSATDTTLVAQVGSRTSNAGGFSDSDNAAMDAPNNVIWWERTFTRVFTIENNVNATEWGLAPGSTGDLSVRELFRTDPLDNNSDPITLVLESGDELHLVITLRLEAHYGYAAESFVITGTAGVDSAGTHEGDASISTSQFSAVSHITNALRAAWPGASKRLQRITADATSIAINQAVSTADPVTMTQQAYTPGTYYRDFNGVFSTSSANGNNYGWIVHDSSATAALHYRFILTDPPVLLKANTHRLTLTYRCTVSRL